MNANPGVLTNLTAAGVTDVTLVGGWVREGVNRIVGNPQHSEQIIRVISVFAEALPMITLHFFAPWYVSLSFWTLYEICQIRLPVADRGISLAFALEAARETGRFFLKGLSKGIVEGVPHVIIAVAGIFLSAYFASRLPAQTENPQVH
jgi:hypothetical protein